MEFQERIHKRLKPMPWRRWPLGFAGSFSKEDVTAFRQGFLPRDMDDQWLVRTVGDWVYVHRSWTGSCIYDLQLRATPQGWAVGRSWVNRNRRDYRGSSLDEERDLCRSLIDRLILSKPESETPPPR